MPSSLVVIKDRILRRDFTKAERVIILSTVTGLVAYLLGIKLFLFPILVILNVLYLPLPTIFRSFVGRIFVSMLVAFSMLPIAGAVQYVFFKGSHFEVAAIFAAIINVSVLLYAPKKQKYTMHFGWVDVGVLLSGVVFLLPFMPILTGNDSFVKTLELSGYQVVDAGHHYSSINHFEESGFLSLGNYPSGFHYAVGFVQNSLWGQLYDIGWKANLAVYFTHYITMGLSLMYAMYYLAASLFEAYRPKRVLTKRKRWQSTLLLVACLAPLAMGAYLIPLFAQGFLNFYFTVAAIMIGIVYLISVRDANVDRQELRWAVFMYLLLGYAAVSTWTLLIPLIVIIGLLYLLPKQINTQNLRHLRRELLVFGNVPIVIIVLFHAVLMYCQLKSIDLSGRGGINESGNLHDLHYLVLLADFAIVTALLFVNKLDEGFRKVLHCVFFPGMAFVGALAIMQYFQIGEVRYYTIKSALLMEMLSFTLIVAVFVRHSLEMKDPDWRLVTMLPFIPIVGMTLLMSPTTSPMREWRELYKPQSGIPMPEFYDHDARKFVELGESGKLANFNAISLHWNKTDQMFDGYMQLSYRANLMHQDNNLKHIELRDCNDRVYSLIDYGIQVDKQKPVITDLTKCFKMADKLHLKYYIITDKASAAQMKKVFGSAPELVY